LTANSRTACAAGTNDCFSKRGILKGGDYGDKETEAGGQPALHFRGGAIFMNFHSMTSSCLFNRGTTFSQTVTDIFFSQHFRKWELISSNQARN